MLFVMRAFIVIAYVALYPLNTAHACAFHFNTTLPKASLFEQITSAASLISARPTREDPFRFGEMTLLAGQPPDSMPPFLVDSVARRQLGAAPENGILFSQNSEGTWERLLLLNETTRPLVDHMLDQKEYWSKTSGLTDRRDFAASLLSHPNSSVRHIALRELDTMNYRTLRSGTYNITSEALLREISDLQDQAFAPTRILLLGILGGNQAKEAIARRLQNRLETDTAMNLGAWVTASVETNGPEAIANVHELVAKRGRNLTPEQSDELVRAFGVLSISGDQSVRHAARSELIHYISADPETSYMARAQAFTVSLFTSAMTDMKSGASTGGVLLAAFIAFCYGAVHTLGPGHGKAVVISYFIGTGGSIRNGLLMGAQIAVTHVASAVVIVFLFDFAVRQTTGNAPADYQLIRLLSYGAIGVIGAVMLFRATRAWMEFTKHDHEHSHHDQHSSGCASCAAAANRAGQGSGWLATAIGVVPCTGALMVMLYGLANDLIGPAIAMVVAISMGMACAMAGLGLLAIWGHNLASARLSNNATSQMRFEIGARVLGSTVVLLVGISLFAFSLSNRWEPAFADAMRMEITDNRVFERPRNNLE